MQEGSALLSSVSVPENTCAYSEGNIIRMLGVGSAKHSCCAGMAAAVMRRRKLIEADDSPTATRKLEACKSPHGPQADNRGVVSQSSSPIVNTPIRDTRQSASVHDAERRMSVEIITPTPDGRFQCESSAIAKLDKIGRDILCRSESPIRTCTASPHNSSCRVARTEDGYTANG